MIGCCVEGRIVEVLSWCQVCGVTQEMLNASSKLDEGDM